jgi:hypothetical protein
MRRSPYLFAVVVLGWTVSDVAAQSSRTGYKPDVCIDAAFAQYDVANRDLVKAAAPIMTLEAMILQRRLQEDYCHLVTVCLDDNLAQPLPAVRSTIFSLCLRREALFQYDAVSRK